MTETAACPFCESEITATAKKCRHCGEWISRECRECGTPIRDQWAARGLCADCEVRASGASVQRFSGASMAQVYAWPRKNRTISIGLALVLGGIGANKFYLDQPGKGFFRLMFCWTGIPSILGLIDAVKYIRMEDEEFHQRFVQGAL